MGSRSPPTSPCPSGKPPKGLPLIVSPHGGPALRDTAEFDWWAQAMAAQGYLVLQPNYRGSNVTNSHLEAGFGEWGRKMQTDLSDGVRITGYHAAKHACRCCRRRSSSYGPTIQPIEGPRATYFGLRNLRMN